MTAEQIYNDSIKPLPEIERLRLIAIIVNDITYGKNYNDEWSEQDMREWSLASLRRFEQENPEDESA